jgi:hypothetical protein
VSPVEQAAVVPVASAEPEADTPSDEQPDELYDGDTEDGGRLVQDELSVEPATPPPSRDAAIPPAGPPPDRPLSGGRSGDDLPDPQLADQLFEVYAGTPPTCAEQRAAARVCAEITDFQGLAVPELEVAFDFNNHRQEDGVVAAETVNYQLANFSDTMRSIRHAADAVGNMHEYAREGVNHVFLSGDETIITDRPVRSHQLPNHYVQADDTGLHVIAMPEEAAAAGGNDLAYVRYDLPTGEVHLIRTDSTRRFRVFDDTDGLHIISESPAALMADEIDFFAATQRLLDAHVVQLEAAALEIGVSPGMLACLSSDNPEIATASLADEVTMQVAHAVVEGRLSATTRAGLAISVTRIRDRLRRRTAYGFGQDRAVVDGIQIRTGWLKSYYGIMAQGG